MRTLPNELTEQSLDQFFIESLSTTNDLALDELLTTVGINLKQRATTSYEDAGGKPGKEYEPAPFRLGASFVPDPLGAKVQLIYDDGCLQDAGIAAGDIVIAINNLQATKENLPQLLAPYSADDTVKFHAFRRDELMEFEVTLTEAIQDTYYLEITEKESSKRHIWLHKNISS